jgi:cyclophilin family peptidyl-prolyl cis-trans isomerase
MKMRRLLSSCFGIVLSIYAGLAGAADYPKVLVATTAGEFTLELDTGRSPLSVANFLQYVQEGFYEGTIFHRVVNGFVIQGGGYTADHQQKETRTQIPNESGNGLSNQRMTVAMARTGEPHTADSQFYINLTDNTALDPKATRWGYAVFGEVIAGESVVDDIGHRATSPKGEFQDLPAAPVIIEKMTLITE